MSVYSIATANKVMPCLICGQVQPKNSFLSHISEHLNYKQHKCLECNFTSVTPEEMADHEATNNGHMAQFHVLRNPYLDRVCRFIYNDCDYGSRNGGLDNVLKRKLVSSNEEETSSNLNKEQETKHLQQQLNKAAKTAIIKSEQLLLESTTPIIKNPTQQQTSGNQNKSNNYPELGEQMQNIVVRIKQQISESEKRLPGVNNTNIYNQNIETLNNNDCLMPDDPEIIDIDDEDEGNVDFSDYNVEAIFKNNLLYEARKNKNKQDDTYQNVQCVKCGEWVKGRAICLLYHINTRHLKLPMFRCLACPRDFYYVNETAPKKHMCSFHNNDLSLFENNYLKYSIILRESRAEFYGEALINEMGVVSSQKKLEKKQNNSKKNAIKKPLIGKKIQENKNLNIATTTSNINSLNNTNVGRILEQIKTSQIAIPKVDNVLNSRKEKLRMFAKGHKEHN